MQHPKSAGRTYAGAVAFITGGASGIGASLGRALVAAGARVVLADRDPTTPDGPQAEALTLDVRDAAQVEGAIATVWDRYGRLDYLFNNAGTAVLGEVKDYVLDDWNYVLDVNLRGAIHGIQAAYPRMLRQGGGHIVNMASLAGLVPMASGVVYATSKHALVGLSRTLRIEARRHGVAVSVVCPGPVLTPMLTNGGKHGRNKQLLSEEAQRAFWDGLGFMSPDDLAARILRRVAKGHGLIVEPRRLRVLWHLACLFPSLAERCVARFYERRMRIARTMK
jgi:NAD(P)-dependent dehydrogenase (short-subunit alcohol dehydrogenase family)